MANTFDFGMALAHLKDGKRVARIGWNGKGMWLILVSHGGKTSYDFNVWEVAVGDESYPTGVNKLMPWIGIKTADGGFVPWVISQTDLLAEDWLVIDGRAGPSPPEFEDAMAEPVIESGPPIPGVDYDAELRKVRIVNCAQEPVDRVRSGVYLYGHIYEAKLRDERQSYVDGSFVQSDGVLRWDESTQIATTLAGTRYLITSFYKD